jgi:hypothetical protein
MPHADALWLRITVVNVTGSPRAKSTAFIRNDTSICVFRHVGGGGAGRVWVGVGVGAGLITVRVATGCVATGRGVGLGAGVVAAGDGEVGVVAAATGRAVRDLQPDTAGTSTSTAATSTAPPRSRCGTTAISPPNASRSMPESSAGSNGLKLADDGRNPRELTIGRDLG